MNYQPIQPRLCAIIPARGGSKRLPGKNSRPLGGVPLITHSIRAALHAHSVDTVFVSSDSAEILRIATEEKCHDLALRPASLATDQTSSLAVLQYEIERVENAAGPFDFVVLLQPTSPLRTASDIDAAVKVLIRTQADTLTSVTAAPDANGERWQLADGFLRPALSSAPPLFKENGSIFIVSVPVLKTGRFYGEKIAAFEMDANKSVDIDTLEDFNMAEALFTKLKGTT